MKTSDLILTAIRVAVASVFIVSGFSKLMGSYENFAGVISGYQLFDLQTSERIALVFPWAELVAGVFLLVGLWTRASVYFLWAVNSALLVVVASALIRGIPVADCGCFGEKLFHLTLSQVLILDAFVWCAFYVMARSGSRIGFFGLDRFFHLK